ncbi:MAG: ClbS/DfsB family four-helix bundle protein [Methanomassiliicoccaceae archaeon]|nr:ClbS/DfsB family four-helix bundle protein [Methanomassiliicoccaceae archaeon]
MSRAATKTELIDAAEAQFDKLLRMIGSMSADERDMGFCFGEDAKRKEAHWARDRNLRDVLVHLHEWHLMVGRWHHEGTVKGGMPAVPGEGYTWRTLPDLNRKIWEKYQDVPLNDSETMLRESHAMIMKIVAAHTDAELFSRGLYKWTGNNALGAYFVSCTASHYEWAMTKIKLHIKTCKK